MLELSQNFRFKYRTFRFQHIKTIDQRTWIFNQLFAKVRDERTRPVIGSDQ